MDAGWAPYWFFRFFAPPSPGRLHRWCCPPSARPRSVGREPEPANREGGSKGTTAKSWKRSRRGGDEDRQTSQKERAASGEMRIGVWFDCVSFCHNVSELRDRAGKPTSELGPRDALKKDSRGLCRGRRETLVSLAFCRFQRRRLCCSSSLDASHLPGSCSHQQAGLTHTVRNDSHTFIFKKPQSPLTDCTGKDVAVHWRNLAVGSASPLIEVSVTHTEDLST